MSTIHNLPITHSATPVRVVGSRVLRVCRRGVLTPQSTVEGGDESVKNCANKQLIKRCLGLNRRPPVTATREFSVCSLLNFRTPDGAQRPSTPVPDGGGGNVLVCSPDSGQAASPRKPGGRRDRVDRLVRYNAIVRCLAVRPLSSGSSRRKYRARPPHPRRPRRR